MESLFYIKSCQPYLISYLGDSVHANFSRNNWHIYLVKDRNRFKYIENIKQFKVVIDALALHVRVNTCNGSQLMVVAKDFWSTL